MRLLIGVCSSQQDLVCDIWCSCVLMSVGCRWEVQPAGGQAGGRGGLLALCGWVEWETLFI